MRTFGQVPLSLWRDPNFLQLSEDGMLALLFMWTGPHSTSAGVYVLLDGYAAIDLGWDLSRWVIAREEVEKAGLVSRDGTSQTILVRGYYTANRPSNAKHLAAIKNQIAAITCEALQSEAWQALQAFMPPPPAPSGSLRNLDTPFLQRARR